MVVAAWIALLAASFVIFAQAGLSLYLMLYTWENSKRLAASGGPRAFLPPQLSFAILLPARHEEAVIFQTIKRVWEADYPRELIEIVVVCHASDTGTITEAQRAIREIGSPRVRVETFTDGPISKPRGLNVGLQRTTNEVITIFDAEDDVDPAVFNMVNTVMLQETTGVVQAGVQLMNFRDHWFSVHNCLEYFFYFKSRLHFHAKVGMIPLGGNTVFIRRDLMNRLGGWDENCLTEDADIGLRLSALGERIRVVYDPQRVTREETPDSVTSFLRQRTRWNQGFLQVLRKGSWRSLSTRSQKVLAMYTMTYPVFHGMVTMLWPLVLVAVVLIKVPVVIALASFLPLYALLLQLAINVAGVYVFAGEYGLKVPIFTPVGMAVSFLPFQFLLGCSALRAVYREARSQNDWEKTAHLGAHRRPEISLPADYESLLEETLSRLGVERGSVMVLDDEGRAFSIGASRGLSANVVDSARVGIGEGVAGWVARTETPVLINGRNIPDDLRGRLSQPDLLSSIVLPIKRDSSVAVLSLSSKRRELDEESLNWASSRVNTLFPAQTVRSAPPAQGEEGEALSTSRAATIETPDNGRPVADITHPHPSSPSNVGETPVHSTPGRDRDNAMPSGRSKRKPKIMLVFGSLVCTFAFLSWSNLAIGDNDLPHAPVVTSSNPPPYATNRTAVREDVIQSVRSDSSSAPDLTEHGEDNASALILAEHRVVAGDTLASLAQGYYGDEGSWVLIWDRNKGMTDRYGRTFDDPNRVYSGWILKIPGQPHRQTADPKEVDGGQR